MIVLVVDDVDLCWFIFINFKVILIYIILYDDVQRIVNEVKF